MASNATLTQPEREHLLEAEDLYRQIMQLVGRDLGLADWGSKVNHVSFDSDSEYAHTLQNQGTGGHLNVPGVLQATSSGVTASTLGVTNNASIGGNLSVTGTLSAGASTLASLSVTGNASVGGTLGVTGAVGFSSTLAVTGLISANGGLTTTDLTATGNTALGNADTDTLTVLGVSTFRNTANTATQLFVDAANNRVIVGTATALGTTTDPSLQVVGRLYVAPPSANDSAVQVRRSSAATVGWTFGVTAANDLAFKDDSDTERVRFGDGSSTDQLVVTGNALITGATSITGLLDGSAAVFGAGALSGSEELRVVGTTQLEGGLTVTTGGIAVTGNSQITGSLDITGDVSIGNASTDQIRFYNGTLSTRQSVTGSRGGGVALINLLQKLDLVGLITDATVA